MRADLLDHFGSDLMVAWLAYGSPMYHRYVGLGLGMLVFYGGEYRKFGSAGLRQAILRGRRLVEGQL